MGNRNYVVQGVVLMAVTLAAAVGVGAPMNHSKKPVTPTECMNGGGMVSGQPGAFYCSGGKWNGHPTDIL
jgi:hypothetical protein